MNHCGSKWSQPATIGKRVLPVKLTLPCATRSPITSTIATGTICAATPNGRAPTLNTCATGPIRSICSTGTSAIIEAVPRMNISAITGAAITTDSAIDFTGCRHSPARIATYSKPPSAPNPILLRMFKLNRETEGPTNTNG